MKEGRGWILVPAKGWFCLPGRYLVTYHQSTLLETPESRQCRLSDGKNHTLARNAEMCTSLALYLRFISLHDPKDEFGVQGADTRFFTTFFFFTKKSFCYFSPVWPHWINLFFFCFALLIWLLKLISWSWNWLLGVKMWLQSQ